MNAPTEAEIELIKEGNLSQLYLAGTNPQLMENCSLRKLMCWQWTLPRISRAQALDALSSMANISGYRAVIEAANAFGSFFTGQLPQQVKYHRQKCW